jgi:hypothetical protein
MQWRIAISWISGYFLGQIYPLILFYYDDDVCDDENFIILCFDRHFCVHVNIEKLLENILGYLKT